MADNAQWLESLKIGDKVAVAVGARSEYGIATVVERSTRKNAKNKVIGIAYATGGPVCWYDVCGYSNYGDAWGRNSIEPITERIRDAIRARQLKNQIRIDIDAIQSWLRDADVRDQSKDVTAKLVAVAERIRSAKEWVAVTADEATP